MAVIAPTNFKGSNGATTVLRTVLTASDSLVYAGGSGSQVLELFNTSGATVNVVLRGNAATTASPSGFGGTVDVSAGKTIAVPANSTVSVNLDTIAAYLNGTSVLVTGGTGVTAHLYQF